jgi:hypothetical protein
MNHSHRSKKQIDPVSCLVPEGGTPQNPFPISIDDLNEAVIASAPSGDEGRAEVESHCDCVFLKRQGQWKEILERAVAAKERGRKCELAAYESALKKEKATPETIQIETEGFQMPQGPKRWVVYGLSFSCFALAALACMNLARFAVSETQGWLSAFLYVAPLLFVPLGIKRVYEKARGDVRVITNIALVSLGLISFAVFAWSFATRFGFTPSPTQLDRNPSLAFIALDMRAQILSQIGLEVILGLGAFLWLVELVRVKTTEVENPDYATVARIRAEREAAVAETEHEIGQLKGLLVQWENSRNDFKRLGVAVWRMRLKEQEERERIRQGRESSRRAQQEALERFRQEQEAHWRAEEASLEQRVAKWRPSSGNGKNGQPRIIQP